MIKLGVYQQGINWDWNRVRDFWVAADRLGFDAGWMMDNVVYPDSTTGEMLDVWETWTVLSVLAEITDNIRFGPLVTPCRRRNPCLLAKTASSIDRISNGRLDLGIGSGDDPIYFIPWGQSYPEPAERIAYLREEIDILKSLWIQESTDYAGQFYTLNEATNNPKPVQLPHPPIWVGIVMGRKVMPKLAAEQADAINVYNASDVAVSELLTLVEKHCESIGRDYSKIPKSRTVNVIITDGKSEVPAHTSRADGSFQHVIGSTDERVLDIRRTLDDQFEQLKAASEKYDIYSKLTERHVVGSPTQIAEQLVEIAGDTFDQLVVHGLNSKEALIQFAEEIMPMVRSES